MARWPFVWMLVRRDLGRMRLGYLGSVIMAVYFALLSSFMFKNIHSPDAADFAWGNIMLDFVFLAAVGTFGFCFSRDYFKYWRNRCLTDRLSFLKKLPAATGEIVLGRMFTMVLVSPVMAAIFFTVIYAVTSVSAILPHPGQYVEFALVWYGYSLAMSGFYLYWELGYPEKTYWKVNWCIMLGVFIVPAALWPLDANVVNGTMRAVLRFGALAPAVTIAIGVGALALSYKLTVKQVDARDLTTE